MTSLFLSFHSKSSLLCLVLFPSFHLFSLIIFCSGLSCFASHLPTLIPSIRRRNHYLYVFPLLLNPHYSVTYHLPPSLPLSFFLSPSVGGAFVLGTYTILFLKLYSYKDVNMWCRELSAAKAKKLARSLSCKSRRRSLPDFSKARL